ncbi:MAG: ECF transporter S component [Erysipelotrichaceae bacterium]|nr:ECF transporter S component [Erysipelotrichaceae bacterium]
MNHNLKTVQKICIISILSVLSYLLMYVRFPLPIAPSFYEMDFANIPTLFGAIFLGPYVGIGVELLRFLLKLIFIPTSTFFIGEFSGLMVNLALIIPVAIIYKQNKTYKNLIMALIVGIISFTLIAALTNYFIIIPMYVSVMKLKLETIISIGHAINANVNSLWNLIWICTIPFNLIKGGLNALIVVMAYYHMVPIFKRHSK